MGNRQSSFRIVVVLRRWLNVSYVAVSYTHLDVYKRQTDSILRTRLADPAYGGDETYMITEDKNGDCLLYTSFYNLRGGKERIFDDRNNGFGWNRLPKSFMAQNIVCLLYTSTAINQQKFSFFLQDQKGTKVGCKPKVIAK